MTEPFPQGANVRPAKLSNGTPGTVEKCERVPRRDQWLVTYCIGTQVISGVSYRIFNTRYADELELVPVGDDNSSPSVTLPGDGGEFGAESNTHQAHMEALKALYGKGEGE